jgi:hypothetical protein
MKLRPSKKEKDAIREEFQRVFGRPAPEGVRAFQLQMWINDQKAKQWR